MHSKCHWSISFSIAPGRIFLGLGFELLNDNFFSLLFLLVMCLNSVVFAKHQAFYFVVGIDVCITITFIVEIFSTRLNEECLDYQCKVVII